MEGAPRALMTMLVNFQGYNVCTMVLARMEGRQRVSKMYLHDLDMDGTLSTPSKPTKQRLCDIASQHEPPSVYYDVGCVLSRPHQRRKWSALRLPPLQGASTSRRPRIPSLTTVPRISVPPWTEFQGDEPILVSTLRAREDERARTSSPQ